MSAKETTERREEGGKRWGKQLGEKAGCAMWLLRP